MFPSDIVRVEVPVVKLSVRVTGLLDTRLVRRQLAKALLVVAALIALMRQVDRAMMRLLCKHTELYLLRARVTLVREKCVCTVWTSALLLLLVFASTVVLFLPSIK